MQSKNFQKIDSKKEVKIMLSKKACRKTNRSNGQILFSSKLKLSTDTKQA